jgi:hypothetical protein
MNAPVTTTKPMAAAPIESDPRAAFTATPESVKITEGCGRQEEFPLEFNGADESRTVSEVVDRATTIRFPARGTIAHPVGPSRLCIRRAAHV